MGHNEALAEKLRVNIDNILKSASFLLLPTVYAEYESDKLGVDSQLLDPALLANASRFIFTVISWLLYLADPEGKR